MVSKERECRDEVEECHCGNVYGDGLFEFRSEWEMRAMHIHLVEGEKSE